MKSLASVLLFFSTFSSFAQRETFDLVTYTIPTGWKKVGSTAGVVGFATTNNQKRTYCQIALYKSMNTMGNAQLDFETDWQDLVVKPYKVTDPPVHGESRVEDAWEIKSGVAPYDFNGVKSMAMLVTMSGYGKRVSFVILTNSQDYQTEIDQFLTSVDVKKPETTSPVSNTNDNHSIIGTWNKSASPNQQYDDYKRPFSTNDNGYQKDQYTFNTNGTYSYFSKSFRMTFDKLLLVRENGTYEIRGNELTVHPQKSVIEAWTKQNGTDKWGQLLTTQNRTLETATYQFTKHYFTGIQEWNLVLQAGQKTQRDGPFSSNTTFSNAYYFVPVSSNHPVIELPDSQSGAQETKTPSTGNGGFTFTTSNFDDGWVASVQEDWVQVTKSNTKVLIHYPNKNADDYNPVLLDGLRNAWNVLVAPKYSTASNFEFKPISGWQSVEFAEADAVERATGKSVHVVLFKINYSGGNGRFLEFITPDKRSFEQEFGAYHQTSDGWENLEKMANYNKFAVAASDLKGKWTNKFSGTLQYVNVYTGANAGMDTHASNENFEFGPGTTYHWDLGVASGQVGNIKFQSVKSTGQFSMSGNWQINFSDIEGKPRTYSVSFSCVKGARILWLDNTSFGKIQ